MIYICQKNVLVNGIEPYVVHNMTHECVNDLMFLISVISLILALLMSAQLSVYVNATAKKY